MFRRDIGDVRHGYVESALTSQFVVFGDRDETLQAMRAACTSSIAEPPQENVPSQEFAEIKTIYGIGVVAAKYL